MVAAGTESPDLLRFSHPAKRTAAHKATAPTRNRRPHRRLAVIPASLDHRAEPGRLLYPSGLSAASPVPPAAPLFSATVSTGLDDHQLSGRLLRRFRRTFSSVATATCLHQSFQSSRPRRANSR